MKGDSWKFAQDTETSHVRNRWDGSEQADDLGQTADSAKQTTLGTRRLADGGHKTGKQTTLGTRRLADGGQKTGKQTTLWSR
ncbi:hypothetical protein MTO96_008838 [Rhipicephalus appendiculatus]